MKKQILTAGFILGLAFFANAQTGEVKSTSGSKTTTGTVQNGQRPSPSVKTGDRTNPTSTTTTMKMPRGVSKKKSPVVGEKKPVSPKMPSTSKP